MRYVIAMACLLSGGLTACPSSDETPPGRADTSGDVAADLDPDIVADVAAPGGDEIASQPGDTHPVEDVDTADTGEEEAGAADAEDTQAAETSPPDTSAADPGDETVGEDASVEDTSSSDDAQADAGVADVPPNSDGNGDGVACQAACEAGVSCGDDGCGGKCGPGCAQGEVCTPEGACVEPAVGLSGVAAFTWYISYAPCCPENPNYDPAADTTECDLYSACDYSGLFAGFNQQMPLEWVQSNNLVAFFDAEHPTYEEWLELYANKIIRLTKGDVVLDALIADTCGDADCDGCCTANSQPYGKLVDMESWTVLAHFGELDAADGEIQFEILEDCGGLALDECGVCGGDNSTCVPPSVGCATCLAEGKSCYVLGWSDPCMDSAQDFCVNGVAPYTGTWCPDEGAPPPDGGCVAEWKQCGGEGWTGSTECCLGLSCVYDNQWYSQCEP